MWAEGLPSGSDDAGADRMAARVVLDSLGRVAYADDLALRLTEGAAVPATPFERLMPVASVPPIALPPDAERTSHCRVLLSPGASQPWLVHLARARGCTVCRFGPLWWNVGFADDLQSGVFVTGTSDRVVYANPALRRRAPDPGDSAREGPLDDVLAVLGVDQPGGRRLLEAARAGLAVSQEVETRDGSCVLQATPLRYFGETCGALWFCHDAAQSALHDRDALAALAYRLAAMYQHEMRNPLQTAQAALALLRETEPGGAVSDLLQVIEHNIILLSDIVADHRLPRRPPSAAQPVRLSSLVARGMAEASARHDGRRLRFVHVTMQGEPSVVCHVGGMARVFANLFRNAAQIRADATVTVSYAVDPHGVSCRVDDDGPGFPPQILQRILSPRDPTSHFGLALVIATVEAAGGTVAFGDRPGGGARVTIWLPRGSSLAWEREPSPPSAKKAAATSAV